MRRFTLLLLLVGGLVAPLAAQQPPRTSPHETISRIVDGNRLTIVYGRPYSKDPATGELRKIWGGLVPYGKIWRTGADEATLLITQQAIVLGHDATISAGAYTLYTQFDEDGSARLVVNKQLGQWGLQYDEKQDVVRVPLKKAAVDTALTQFTIAIEKDDAGTTGTLKLMWERTEFSVPFVLKK